MIFQDTRKNLVLPGVVLCLFLSAALLEGQTSGVQEVFRPMTITSPGSYRLANNLVVNSSVPVGLTVAANGVTIDMNGHEITGPGGKRGIGILIEGVRGVKVRNGNLAYLAFGVIVRSSNNVVLRDLQIRGQGLVIEALPPETGVMIAQSKNVVVEDNAVYNTGLGVFVRGGQSWGNRVANNTITNNTNGALGICYNPTPDDPEGPRGDLVYGNVITGFGIGIQMKATSQTNVIRGNTIAYIDQAIDNQNETNQEVDNVSVQLP